MNTADSRLEGTRPIRVVESREGHAAGSGQHHLGDLDGQLRAEAHELAVRYWQNEEVPDLSSLRCPCPPIRSKS
jgi:hypothetical protein